ncbi:hypothetical protein [Lysinibacillus agricola]|uniref:hypothetical protein n=1 Tax=Lysinibacillus agricola TaxID=2590012 RepID=UPI003C181F4B
MTIILNKTYNPVNREERTKINENWDRIIKGLTDLQQQILVVAGGAEVDELIKRLNEAIDNANTAVQQAIDTNNEATQEAINANNEALQAALDTVSQTLADMNKTISNANTATEEANTAKQGALDATAQAQTAINKMQSMIDNLRSRGVWDVATQYYTNNIVTFNNNSYIALQDNIGRTPPTLPLQANTYWSLLAGQGLKGDRGEKGDTGAALSILGRLTDVSQLPPVGNAGDAYTVNGDLYVWSENLNEWENVGNIKGEKGDKGDTGAEGESAYRVALDNGFSGTEAEWLASLKGEKGDMPDLTSVWQKNVFNDNSNVMNLGGSHFKKTFVIPHEQWNNSTFVEVASVVIPLATFSGIIKVTYAGGWYSADSEGGAVVLYNAIKRSASLARHTKTILSIDSEFAKRYFISDLSVDANNIKIPIIKGVNSDNPLSITIELDSVYPDVKDKFYQSTISITNTGSATGLGYPWTPQVSSIPSSSDKTRWDRKSDIIAPDKSGGGSYPDPNTSLDSLLITNHANAQSHGGIDDFWHIEQVWYGDGGIGNSRSQIARSYLGANARIKVRHFYDGTWSPWTLLVGSSLPASINATLGTGWSVRAGYYLRYYKDAFGIVHLYGRVDRNGGGTLITTLPVGYRPIENFETGVTQGVTGHTYIEILSDGRVNAPSGVADNTNVLIECSFRTT